MKLQRYDLSYFLGKFFFDVFQNMFAYRSTFNILELKEDKSTVVLLVGNQKGYILLNLTPLSTVFLYNIYKYN